MLIRYYITSLIIAAIMIAVWQSVRALVPGILMIIMATGSIQSNQTNIQSLQQFATDNIMLISWVALMIGVSWLMYVWWHDLLISVIWVSIMTIWAYYLALTINYEDGIIVWHQASIISIIATSVIIGIWLVQHTWQTQAFWGIGAIYFAVIGAIMWLYRACARIFSLTLPSQLCDETILTRAIIIPTTIIFTTLYHDIIRGCATTLLLYLSYGWLLWQLSHYYYPTINHDEITLDLILKWYKTNHISHITNRSRVNDIFTHISQIQPIIRSIIQHIPDIIMLGSYVYLITHLLQWGIMMSDFIAYCLVSIGYASLGYVYQSNSSLHIDTTAQSFVFGYLGILALMITVFASDPMTGSVIGIIWVVINALVVAQYDRLQLWNYMQPHHTQRRVRANTAGAAIIIWVLTQLPIDTVMMIPIILIVMAILWFTIAQSYATLRTIK